MNSSKQTSAYPRYEDIPSKNNVRVIFWSKNEFQIVDQFGGDVGPTFNKTEWQLIKNCIESEI